MRRALCHLTVLMLALVLPAGWCHAQVSGERTDQADGRASAWAFEVLPYAWIPGNFGTITAGGRTAHLDVTVKDALDLATGGNAFTAGGFFEARYGKVFAYADGFGGYVQDGVTETVRSRRLPRLAAGIDANLKLKPVFADFAIGYRLGEWALPDRRRPVILGLYAGARYYWFYQRLRASARLSGPRALVRSVDISKTLDWADPVVGVRWDVPVLDCLELDFRADIGGFGAGSDLSWNLVGGARYWPDVTILSAHPFVAAGYRALDFDYVASGDNGANLQFRGPYVGLGMAF